MHATRLLLTTLLLAVSLPGLLMAQNDDILEIRYIDQDTGHMVLGQVTPTWTVYRNVILNIGIDAVNMKSPCDGKRQVYLVGDGCRVLEGNMNHFMLSVPGDSGSVRIYAEEDGITYLLGERRFRTIMPDTTDPDFLRVYPNGTWKDSLPVLPTYTPPGQVEEDPFMVPRNGFPVATYLLEDTTILLNPIYMKKCDPQPEMDMEAEGATVEPTGNLNEFRLRPDPGAKLVQLRFYDLSNGERKLFYTRGLKVFKEEPDSYPPY